MSDGITSITGAMVMSGKVDSRVFRFSEMPIYSRPSAMCSAIRFALGWSSVRWTGRGRVCDSRI